MIKTTIKMDWFGGCLNLPIGVWSSAQGKYRWISLTFDTGASVTTISPEILNLLGYVPIENNKETLTTASGIEYVSRYLLQSIMIGEIELHDIEAYALKFPEESYSIGVVGLNVLRQFDINLMFSRSIIELCKITSICDDV